MTGGIETAIVVLRETDRPLAERIRTEIGGCIEMCGRKGRDTRTVLTDAFREGRAIVAVMATGAVVRLLAPLLMDKHGEPPVVCLSPDGRTIVPVLGGHRGANQIACDLAEALETVPAITTASDTLLGFALDEPPFGFVLEPSMHLNQVLSRLVEGARLKVVEGSAPWLPNTQIHSSDVVTVAVSDRSAAEADVVFRPQRFALGVGCERHCDPLELEQLARAALREAGIAPNAVACVTSIDLKADETAVHALAQTLGVQARFHDATALEAERDRLANPSGVVFKEVGCHGVSEGAALATVGPDGELVVPKRKSARATVALARSRDPIDPAKTGRARGKLNIVGLGPGSDAWRTPEATAMLRRSDEWVGYSLYLDLAEQVRDDAVRHDFPLGDEERRVRHALELAAKGREVALICSGDAGIYAMATLVHEAVERIYANTAESRVEIVCAPGISALQAAAARSGAPLGHDFCTISLSDLLTPWPDIVSRLETAARGDFVIAFYNPVSKRRRTQLAYARDLLLEHRPEQTPVVLATNLGRPGEAVRTVALRDLDVDDVDMLTVVIVGSSQTRTFKTGEGRDVVYTPRGYAAKANTAIDPRGVVS